MKKSTYTMKDSDRELVESLLGPGWVYIEPDELTLSLEDRIRYTGKYVIYGSKDRVEKLAKKLESKVGGVIEAMKYSIVPAKMTPHGPEDKCALLVYCNKKTRADVMEILESVGIEYFEWKSHRISWREALDDKLFCLYIYSNNPKTLRKISKLVQREEAFEFMESAMKIASEWAPKFRAIGELLDKDPSRKLTQEEIRKLIEQN